MQSPAGVDSGPPDPWPPQGPTAELEQFTLHMNVKLGILFLIK